MSQLPTSTAKPTKPIDPKTIYDQLRKTDYTSAPLTLWIVYKRRNTGEDAVGKAPADNFHFGVRRLETEETLNLKPAKVVQKQIGDGRRIENYTFEGAVEQDSALVEESGETSFDALIQEISNAGPTRVVTKPEQLHAAYAYLIHLQPADSPALFAFRRVQGGWKAKRVLGLINAMLRDNVLVTAEEERLFRFDQRIDFFAAEGLLFVLDKGGFESALNFRAGMEKKRDDLVEALVQTALYNNLELVRELSSTHVRWLKKLAGAHRLGKCAEANWVKRLAACCKEKGWPVEIVNGKIEITEANCELIVRLMNYDLLESPIDHLVFKIDGAKEEF